MERQLQERLVGGAVLVAIAVIVIPELLSGPGARQHEGDAAADPNGNSTLKTYTIDLANGGARSESVARAEPLATVQIDAAPPPEESASGAEQSRPVETAPARESPPAAAAAVSRTEAPAAKPAPPVATMPAAAVPSGDWAVQVGSFASRPTADRLAAQLEQRGYRSFITQYRADGRTLHRVRIGPVANRADADATVRKLKAQGTTATVVAYP